MQAQLAKRFLQHDDNIFASPAKECRYFMTTKEGVQKGYMITEEDSVNIYQWSFGLISMSIHHSW